jgi:hypothetical protein
MSVSTFSSIAIFCSSTGTVMKVLIKIATLFSNAMHNLSNFREVKYGLWAHLLQNMQSVFRDLYYCIWWLFFSEFNETKHTIPWSITIQNCLLTSFIYQAKYVFLENCYNLYIIRKYTFHENVAFFKFWALS